jgi:nicotinamidase-related amidase
MTPTGAICAALPHSPIRPLANARREVDDRENQDRRGGRGRQVAHGRFRFHFPVREKTSMQRAFGLEIPQTLEEVCKPHRMAVLVYDMQVGILRQLPTAAQTTARVVEVLDAARAGGYRVLFSRHVSMPMELAGVAQLRAALAWQRVDSVSKVRPAFPPDAPQTQLVPEVAPLASEAVFDKITMSAFEGTPLDLVLRDCGIVAVAVVGVALEVGIEPTVRHAADLGYIPVVVADACGGRDEAARERALASLAFAGDAIMTDAAAMSALLTR